MSKRSPSMSAARERCSRVVEVLAIGTAKSEEARLEKLVAEVVAFWRKIVSEEYKTANVIIEGSEKKVHAIWVGYVAQRQGDSIAAYFITTDKNGNETTLATGPINAESIITDLIKGGAGSLISVVVDDVLLFSKS